jgi:Protein of unknown function (DUF1666)
LYACIFIYLDQLKNVTLFNNVDLSAGLDRGDQPRDESDPAVAATDLIKVLEDSILTFRLFLKKDKTKSAALFGAHSAAGSSLHQVQTSLDKVYIIYRFFQWHCVNFFFLFLPL